MPYHSARIETCRAALKENSELGEWKRIVSIRKLFCGSEIVWQKSSSRSGKSLEIVVLVRENWHFEVVANWNKKSQGILKSEVFSNLSGTNITFILFTSGCLQGNDRQLTQTTGGQERHEPHPLQCLSQSSELGKFVHRQGRAYSHVRFWTFYRETALSFCVRLF